MNTEPELLNERLERLAIVLDEIMPQCALLVRDALSLMKEQQGQIDRLIEENASNAEMAEGMKELLKEQEELINELLELGYPHNFQHEAPWVVDYLYSLTEIIKKAFKAKESR